MNPANAIAVPALPSLLAGRSLLACLALAALADWLFLGRSDAGLPLILFATGVAACACLTNRPLADGRALAGAAIVLLLGLLPLAEARGQLSVLLAAAATGIFVLRASDNWTGSALRRLWLVLRLYLGGFWQIIADLMRLRVRASAGAWALVSPAQIIVWIVPLVFCGIFLLLFASANPLIDGLLLQLEAMGRGAHADPFRVLFWIAVIFGVWPFLHVRSAVRRQKVPKAPSQPVPVVPLVNLSSLLFSEGAVLRSLVLFNLLFAVQTGLDVAYLWAGAALPSGMNYADYAHRGAYPLMLTALLAAGFVLVALRPGSRMERAGLARVLVLVWIGQNVVLVISSILRLDLYVSVYLLTLWRLAALVWMGMVGAGLVLIIARIALGRSNGWLVQANAIMLAGVIYASSLANPEAFVAQYNVAHCNEVTGKGKWLDADYLRQLGPEALPAFDNYLALGDAGKLQIFSRESLKDLRQNRASLRWRAEMPGGWRHWSYRGYRLALYLAGAGNAIEYEPPTK